MTQAEIINAAREALLPSDKLYHSNLVRFAALVAAAEREVCAALCDRFAERQMNPAECAAAIRNRSNT